MNITIKMLREKRACAEGIVWVKKHLPDGAEYREFIEKLEADGKNQWADWLSGNFEVLVLAEKWRIDSILDAAKGKALSSGYYAKIGSSGDSAQIGSSGDYAKIGSSGDSAQIGSSGDYAKIGSSGYYAKIGSSGYSAQIGSSGYYAKIGSSGYSAQIGSSGYSAQIGSSGYYAQIEATGKNSIVAAVGPGSIARAGENGCIALAWWDEKAKRPRLTVGYVGEDGIEDGKWYGTNENGKLVEVAA